jgi:hypothetical protein
MITPVTETRKDTDMSSLVDVKEPADVAGAHGTGTVNTRCISKSGADCLYLLFRSSRNVLIFHAT